jgi:hypothetical protein
MDIYTGIIIFLIGFFIGMRSENSARNWYLKRENRDKDK